MENTYCIEQINVESVKSKIELVIRQMVALGQPLYENFGKVHAESIGSTIIKESCCIIITTIESDSVREPAPPLELEKFSKCFYQEINNLYEYLQQFNGYPITLYYGKIQLGIKEAVEQLYDKLIKILEVQ